MQLHNRTEMGNDFYMYFDIKKNLKEVGNDFFTCIFLKKYVVTIFKPWIIMRRAAT